MADALRLIRSFVFVVAVVLLPLSLTPAAFAAQVSTAVRQAPASSSPASQSRTAALAARRALVHRDTSFATEQASSRKAAARLRAKARKLAPKVNGAAAATVTAWVDYALLTGPDDETIYYCNGTCSAPGGDVGPGEPLTVWEELGLTGDTTGTDYTVQLSWTESCGGSTVKTFGSQIVTMNGTLWWPASGTSYDAASTCPGSKASSLPNYDLTLNMAVTGGARQAIPSVRTGSRFLPGR